MKPVARLLISALTIFLAVILAFVLFGAVLDLLRCGIIATVAALGGIFLYRTLTQRATPASKQIIDQTPNPPIAPDDTSQVAQQIEERKERLSK
jgi:hypothetical protein